MDPFIHVITTNGLLFLISIIFWKFPPKKINSFYGYKTNKAMLNQDIWDFANAVFNKNLLRYAGISFLAAIVLAAIASKELSWQPMVLILLTILVSFMKTERALKDNFTEEGERIKK